jgi:hypothetical protein
MHFYAGNKWMPVTKQGRKIVLTWETASSLKRILSHLQDGTENIVFIVTEKKE